MAMGFGPNLSNTSPNILTKELCLVGNWSYVPSHIVLKKKTIFFFINKMAPIQLKGIWWDGHEGIGGPLSQRTQWR
jgi:hypothetical protein